MLVPKFKFSIFSKLMTFRLERFAYVKLTDRFYAGHIGRGGVSWMSKMPVGDLNVPLIFAWLKGDYSSGMYLFCSLNICCFLINRGGPSLFQATLAVVRKLVEYLMTVDRRGTPFE